MAQSMEGHFLSFGYARLAYGAFEDVRHTRGAIGFARDRSFNEVGLGFLVLIMRAKLWN